MEASNAPPMAVATIAAMITPALSILGSASLIATVLVRMARVVDRARALAQLADNTSFEAKGVTRELLATWLTRHASRAGYAERSIALLYGAIVLFVVTSLSIVAGRFFGAAFQWVPIGLAVCGTCLLLAGVAFMVGESRLAGSQITEEIEHALRTLTKGRS